MQKSRSKWLLIGLVVLVVVAGVSAWLLMGGDAAAPADQSNEQRQTQSDAAPSAVQEDEDAVQATTITFTDDGFEPAELTVKKGSVVTVKNNSAERVQFSSDDHPTHRLNTEMNLRTLQPGEAASFTAETVGRHGFHDHIDDSKTGTLIVTE